MATAQQEVRRLSMRVAQREVLAILIERIVPVRERQSVYRVDITWTPLGETLRAMTAA